MQAAWKAGANKCLIKSTCGPKLLVEEVRKLLAPTSAAPPAPMTSPGASVALRPACDASAGSQSAEKGGDQPASDLRRDLLGKLPQHLMELRSLLQSLGKTGDATPLTHLLELHRSVHRLANSASLAGLTHVAQICYAPASTPRVRRAHEKLRCPEFAAIARSTLFPRAVQRTERKEQRPECAWRMAVHQRRLRHHAACHGPGFSGTGTQVSLRPRVSESGLNLSPEPSDRGACSRGGRRPSVEPPGSDSRAGLVCVLLIHG